MALAWPAYWFIGVAVALLAALARRIYQSRRPKQTRRGRRPVRSAPIPVALAASQELDDTAGAWDMRPNAAAKRAVDADIEVGLETALRRDDTAGTTPDARAAAPERREPEARSVAEADILRNTETSQKNTLQYQIPNRLRCTR